MVAPSKVLRRVRRPEQRMQGAEAGSLQLRAKHLQGSVQLCDFGAVHVESDLRHTSCLQHHVAAQLTTLLGHSNRDRDLITTPADSPQFVPGDCTQMTTDRR